MFNRTKVVRASLLCVMAVVAAQVQNTTGEIKGAVQDPTDAFVPKAVVTARDLSTGLSFPTASGADGEYLVPNFLPGTYTVTFVPGLFPTPGVSANLH